MGVDEVRLGARDTDLGRRTGDISEANAMAAAAFDGPGSGVTASCIDKER